jgi:hypothetical protein
MQAAADDRALITRTREPRFPPQSGREFGVALDDRGLSIAGVRSLPVAAPLPVLSGSIEAGAGHCASSICTQAWAALVSVCSVNAYDLPVLWR